MKSTRGNPCGRICLNLCALALPSLLVACTGVETGTLMAVSATLSDTTCGSGALAADETWKFNVRVTIEDSTFKWYDVSSDTTTEGSIDDGEFAVSDASDYVITTSNGITAGCTLRRRDKFSGAATVDASKKPTKLSGTLVFKYSQATGYSCDALIGASNGIDDLPCEIDYSFSAKPTS